MSAIVDAALTRAGLDDVLAARLAGDLAAVRARAVDVARADLLVLGALADAVRRAEVGDAVRVVLRPGPEIDAPPALVGRGVALLREVAVARVTGVRAARVRVDFAAVGLEIALVALAFGADELAGDLATKRGLPLADGATTDRGKRSQREPLARAKRRELEDLVRRAGRAPVFVGAAWDAAPGEAHA